MHSHGTGKDHLERNGEEWPTRQAVVRPLVQAGPGNKEPAPKGEIKALRLFRPLEKKLPGLLRPAKLCGMTADRMAAMAMGCRAAKKVMNNMVVNGRWYSLSFSG